MQRSPQPYAKQALKSVVSSVLGVFGRLHRILQAPSRSPETHHGSAPASAVIAGLFSGSLLVLVASAVIWLIGDVTPSFQWDQIVPPELVTAGCVIALLLFFHGEPSQLPWILLATGVASLVPAAVGQALLMLGQQPVLAPIELGIIAAVLCALIVSPGNWAIRIAHARAASIEATHDGILVVDQAGHLVDANPIARATLNLPPPVLWPESPPMAPKAIRHVLEDPKQRRQRMKSASGRVFEAWTSPLESSGPLKGLRGVLIRDVTSRHRNERRLVHLAHNDSLTGLANRRQFLDNLVQALEAAEIEESSVAIYYIDLDHFKGINDSFGHATGDAFLQTLAERFSSHIRKEEFLALCDESCGEICFARLAGDEFALIAPGIKGLEATNELGEKILALLNKPVKLASQTLTSSGSVGISVYPEDGSDAETLIRHADTALYVAKHRGRKRVARFERAFEEKSDRERLIKEGLANAIDLGELRVHYQPKIDLASGTVAGFEALLRWTSAELGVVTPAEFIPIAEGQGLICELGAWCLDQTCQQLRKWQDSGLVTVPISVNVSSIQFAEMDLQRVVCDALKKFNIDPQLLELELTESLLFEEGETTEVSLRDLRSIGLRVALDDFGTGYSAITCLNRFPLDVLKMDRSLLRDIATSGSAEGIASAVVAMAHSLGLTVVAEGIDLESQLEPLRRMKCDQVQGFIYAQALPADEAYRYLAREGERPPIARPNLGPLEVQSIGEDSRGESLDDDMLPIPKSLADDSSTGPSLEAAISRAEVSSRVLIVDDQNGSLGPVALRLGRLGVDMHHATALDEAHLFINQEKELIRLLAISPDCDLEEAGKVLEHMAREIGARPPLVVLGVEPDAKRKAEIRKAGADWVLWAPFDDEELRFLVKCAMALPAEVSERKNVRFPINLMASLRMGTRREVAVISSLSERGAFIEMKELPGVGAQLRVEFDLGNERFRGFARVVYQQREDSERVYRVPGVGVVFFGCDRDAERLLREVVKECRARYML